MPSARERAKQLANEIKKAMQEARAAEARAKTLGEEMMRVLVEAKAEAEVERTIVEYPSGRYDCLSCGQVVIFTESYSELPPCDHCGNRKYSGQTPKVTRIKPPPPKKHRAGIYDCAGCGGRLAVAEDTDVLACDFCGSAKLKAVTL